MRKRPVNVFLRERRANKGCFLPLRINITYTKPNLMDQLDQPLFDLRIDSENTVFLSETARWGRFLSILGFIFCGLLVIVALFAGSLIATSMQSFGAYSSF